MTSIENQCFTNGKRVIGLVYKMTTFYPGSTGYTVSFNDNALSSLGTHFWTKINRIETHDNVKNTITNIINGYDAYGNVTSTETDINNGQFGNITMISYVSAGIRGIPNKPQYMTNTQVRNFSSNDTYTSRTDFEYFSNGNLKKQTIFADKGQPLATTYTYNGFGNVTKTEANAPNDPSLAVRYKTYTYDTKGRMPISEGNTLGQTTYTTAETDIDWRYGNPLKRTLLGVAGNYTFTYDAFGRGKTVTSPEGITATTDFKWDIRTGGTNDESTPDNAVYSADLVQAKLKVLQMTL
jgi:hypothetical protein